MYVYSYWFILLLTISQ